MSTNESGTEWHCLVEAPRNREFAKKTPQINGEGPFLLDRKMIHGHLIDGYTWYVRREWQFRNQSGIAWLTFLILLIHRDIYDGRLLTHRHPAGLPVLFYRLVRHCLLLLFAWGRGRENHSGRRPAGCCYGTELRCYIDPVPLAVILASLVQPDPLHLRFGFVALRVGSCHVPVGEFLPEPPPRDQASAMGQRKR